MLRTGPVFNLHYDPTNSLSSKHYEGEFSAYKAPDYVGDTLVAREASVQTLASGFNILSEGTSIQPLDPVERNEKDVTRLTYNSFNFQGDNPPAPGTKLRVPIIEYNLIQPSLETRPSWNYAYPLFSYRGRAADTDADPVYLFTGYNEKVATFVMPNTVFRYKDLEDRLRGSTDERARLFARDWRVALIGMEPHELQELYKKDNRDLEKRGLLPRLRDDIDVTSLDAIRVVHKEMAEALEGAGTVDNCSHFPVWDDRGTLLSPLTSAKFLGKLLAPLHSQLMDQTPSSNLPRFIFGRFCKLLYSAAVGPLPEWDVMARYWNKPIEPKVHFWYQLPAVLHNRLTAIAGYQWRKAIKTAHKNVWDAVSKDGMEQKFIPADEAKFLSGDLKGYHKLGSHPQGLYTVYVSDSDWGRMMEKYIRPSKWEMPTDGWDPTNQDLDIQENGLTWACVTKAKVANARFWGRATGQVQLMGAPASEMANRICLPKGGEQPKFEWLHRCAFSFGGVGGSDTGPDSAQATGNLVLGTAEANTTMMRYESYIKRLAHRQFLQQGGVYVYTSLDYPGTYKQKKVFWMAPTLRYKWAISTVKDNVPGTNYRVVNFPLFSRTRPTTFEVMMDRAVEKVIFDTIPYIYDALLETGNNGLGEADEIIPEV
ncbi:hypothetical protein VNI00_006238 [Paramarasmius palmivorus]|uniref:Capsid protein n=1 Tax=Paramarasmius palmivorus TaxID=297713 RepID=A0AAW0D7U1_9AGAR